MENIIRVVSWTVVLGAVAALVYTSFKPFWKELASFDVPEDKVRGTIIARDQAQDAEPVRPLAEAQPANPGRCPAEGAPRSDDNCHPNAP